MHFNNFTIFRYLFLDILKPFFIISLVLTGIAWLSRSLNYIELIINKGLSLPVYFWFVSLIAPKILSILLPLISFASISYSYNKLRSDSEIIAMECAGVSKSILIVPALFFSLCVAFLVFIIESQITHIKLTTCRCVYLVPLPSWASNPGVACSMGESGMQFHHTDS